MREKGFGLFLALTLLVMAVSTQHPFRQPVYNCKDPAFGAAANGSTDDTEALQDCIDAAEAFQAGRIGRDTLSALLDRTNRELDRKGFVVRDSKAHHIIIRPVDSSVATNRQGNIVYALVDFELLERTPQHERSVRAAKRRTYLIRQAHRFETREQFPATIGPALCLSRSRPPSVFPLAAPAPPRPHDALSLVLLTSCARVL